MSRKKSISIILPTYNEEDNIIKLINKIQNIVGKIKARYEIIIVDDKSNDKTAKRVQAFSKKHKNIKLIIRTKNRSLAKSILTGLKLATADMVIVMDSDFNHDPSAIPQMITLLNHYDIVIGSRYVSGGGMDDTKREFASFFYNLFIKILLKTRIHDNLSGFFAIKQNDLNKLPFKKIFYGYGDYFIRLIYYARQNKLNFIEIPVWYRIRESGVSKSSLLKMLYTYTKSVFNLRFN